MSNQLLINVPQPTKKRVLLICSFLLIGLSIAYLGKGFYHALFVYDTESAKDLWARWLEQQYIYQGEYPYYARPNKPTNVIEGLGPVFSGGYPPWAFLTGFLFVPNFSWQTTRFYYVLLNIISLIVLAIFSYSATAPKNKAQAFFAVASSLAISSNCTTLRVGQYGLIINALLIGAFWMSQNKRYSWAGLFLGLALVKPNISAFYFLIFLVRRQFKIILVFFLYLSFATFLISILTQVSPASMFEDLIKQINYFVLKGTSLINYLNFNENIEPSFLIFLIGGVSLISLLILFYLFRNASLLTLFAASCVIARLCTYHRIYDDVMLVFLLLAFLKMLYQNPQIPKLVIFIALGLSLWLPAGLSTFIYFPWTMFQFTIWVTALGYLFVNELQQMKKLKGVNLQ